MPIVYGASASPFVRKVRAFLAEKGLAYEREDVMPINVSAEFRKISPLGKIPALRDGDRTLADSSVICAYIERTHPDPPLYPGDAYDYARALWFEEYADTALVNVIGAKIFFKKVVAPVFLNQPVNDAEIQKSVDEELPPLFDYLEGQLGGANALVGNRFSIGDIAVGSMFVNLRHAGFGVDPKRWPKLARYVAAVHERPSFHALIAEDRATYGFGG